MSSLPGGWEDEAEHNPPNAHTPSVPLLTVPSLRPLTIYPKPPERPQSKGKAAAKAIIRVPLKILKFALRNPRLLKNIAFPLALTTFSAPIIASLPLGPLGPLLACVAVACGRFTLRGELMGGGYALMHTLGMASVKGQAVSLLGMVGLEALGVGKLRDTFFKTMFEKNIGPRAQVLGLAIAVATSATGAFGSLGGMLGARSMTLLFGELRAFATFMGLKWVASNLNGMWMCLVGASGEVKAAFVRWAARNDLNVEHFRAVGKEMPWVRDYLGKLAKKLKDIPTTVLSPELALLLKSWQDMKVNTREVVEPLDEWTMVDMEGETDIEGEESAIIWEVDEESMINIEALSGEALSPAIWAAHRSIQVEAGDAATIESQALIGDAKAWEFEVEELEDVEDGDEGPELEDLDYMVWEVASQH